MSVKFPTGGFRSVSPATRPIIFFYNLDEMSATALPLHVRLLFSGAVGAGVADAINQPLNGHSWAIYLAIILGYSTGVVFGIATGESVMRGLDSALLRHLLIVHATFLAAVLTLVRVGIYGGAFLPSWLTATRPLTAGRFSRVPSESYSLLVDAVGIVVFGLMVIEILWLLRKFAFRAEGERHRAHLK